MKALTELTLRWGDARIQQICGTLFFTWLFYCLRGLSIPTFTVKIHFGGFRTLPGVPWDPFYFSPLKCLILTRSAFLLTAGPFLGENFWNLHQGASRSPLICRLKKKKIFVDVWPQINRELAKILDGSNFAREWGKVILSRAQKFKNNICSWVLGDEYLG